MQEGRNMFTSKADERIGRKIEQQDGSIAECIGYDKHNDCTFRLGNGSVIKSSWYMFENGQLMSTE